MTENPQRATVRERNKLAIRSEITEAALRLFQTNGFASTTVEQIAEAAGISRRTFFHHFPTKEDVVLGDTQALGDRVRLALEARPADESAWMALSEVFRAMEGGDDLGPRLALARMYHDVPSLRARHIEKHLRWQALLAGNVAQRLGIPEDRALDDPRPRAVIAAALSCLDVAIDAWGESGGKRGIAKIFYECADAIRA